MRSGEGEMAPPKGGFRVGPLRLLSITDVLTDEAGSLKAALRGQQASLCAWDAC